MPRGRRGFVKVNACLNVDVDAIELIYLPPKR